VVKICVDTSFLITFADPSRPHHSVAVDYFRHCVGNGHMLCLSTLVVAEFECGQPITDLPLGNFEIIPFNFRHAVDSAKYHRQIKGMEQVDEANRSVVRNDLKILAQAQIEECSVILTEDSNTLTRWADRLRSSDHCRISSLLLKDGFRPDELRSPKQKTLGL
jgi:predicted nucleic acid-binding protein